MIRFTSASVIKALAFERDELNWGKLAMDHLLAGTDIRLTYLQDRRALARIDWPAIFDDLIDAGAPPNRCLWCDLDRLTHVVLATDRATGHYAGLLGLSGRTTGQDIWLLIDAAMTRPGDAGDGIEN